MCLYILSSVLLISLGFLCCPVMCLYVLISVLLISLVCFALSCYVSLCSEFRVAHFFSFFVLSCNVALCSEFRVTHFFSFFVLSCYVALCFPCCDVRYDFRIKTMLCSSLPPAVCSRVHVLFTLFVFV